MRLRQARHYLLLFAVGISWGYVAKTIVGKYAYIGYDDPQIAESARAYPIKRHIQIDESQAAQVKKEKAAVPVSTPEEVEIPESKTPGTVSI